MHDLRRTINLVFKFERAIMQGGKNSRGLSSALIIDSFLRHSSTRVIVLSDLLIIARVSHRFNYEPLTALGVDYLEPKAICRTVMVRVYG